MPDLTLAYVVVVGVDTEGDQVLAVLLELEPALKMMRDKASEMFGEEVVGGELTEMALEIGTEWEWVEIKIFEIGKEDEIEVPENCPQSYQGVGNNICAGCPLASVDACPYRGAPP